MSHSSSENEASTSEKKYRGVRRRKWGKWVSEIRVPGTLERLWLGTYATPEAAAVAHDVAFFCLRRPESLNKLNFPDIVSSYGVVQGSLSPNSVQKAASDAGMAVDADHILRNTGNKESCAGMQQETDARSREHNDEKAQDDGFSWEKVGDDEGRMTWEDHGEALTISIDDYL